MEGQASPDANLAEGNLCILTGLVLLASCFRRAPVPSGRVQPNPPARQFLCLRFAMAPRRVTGKTRGRNKVASPFP